MMRRRPQCRWQKHKVTVVLQVNGQAPVLAVRQCRTNRRGIAITDAYRAGLTDVMIVLVKVPELPCPVAHTVTA